MLFSFCSHKKPANAMLSGGKSDTNVVAMTIIPIDLPALRAQVRAMDYVRGTAAEMEQWREANAEACANLAIEGMDLTRSEEHTSELQSLMRISYAVFCLKKKTKNT